MLKDKTLCAVDLGAESGRVLWGRFDGRTLQAQDIHRFANRPVCLGGTLTWNILSLYDEILQGLGKIHETSSQPISTVGVDAWGVDFGLLDAQGQLVGLPVHYRDRRTNGLIEEVTGRIPAEEIFAATGIAFWPFNTLYQLYAVARERPHLLRDDSTLLFIPDLLHYWLCGARVSERSIASTSQCLALSEDRWEGSLLSPLGIPTSIFPEVVPSGTILGDLTPYVREQTGLSGVQVITPASHDTASTVVATPLSSPDAAYLSCGTWSLLGIESLTPLTTHEALQTGFSNEKGIGRSYCILRNIMGHWLLQQVRKVWAKRHQQYEYAEMAARAREAPAFQAWVDPNDSRFLAPTDMVTAVQGFCADRGQSVPESMPEITRCLLESLAFAYRQAIEQLETMTGRKIPCLHLTGGGVNNRVLCQWTANALQRPVIAGPEVVSSLLLLILLL